MATVVKILVVFALAIGIYFLCRGILSLVCRRGGKVSRSQWQQYLTQRNLAKRCLLIIPGIVLYFLLYSVLERGSEILVWMHKLDIIYLTIVFLMVANSLMFTFLDLYSHTDKNKTHPLKGLIQGLQVIVFFIGAILYFLYTYYRHSNSCADIGLCSEIKCWSDIVCKFITVAFKVVVF